MSRRTLVALVAASGCAALTFLAWALAFRTGFGGAADEAALRGFAELQGTWVAALASSIATLCDPLPYAVLAAAVTVVALATRGVRGALVVASILVLPNALTQLLKTGLAEDRVAGSLTPAVHVVPASWPSGHSTAAMALALCAVIAAPSAVRLLVAAGGALFAAAVAYSVVLLGWHFPSDALGGFAIAGTGASLGVAVLSAAGNERRVPSRMAASALTALAGLVLAALLARVAIELPGTGQRGAFLAGGAAIVTFGLALAAGVAVALSRPAATTAPPSRWPRATG